MKGNLVSIIRYYFKVTGLLQPSHPVVPRLCCQEGSRRCYPCSDVNLARRKLSWHHPLSLVWRLSTGAIPLPCIGTASVATPATVLS